MSPIVTPDQIITELRAVAARAENGPSIIHDAEVAYDAALRVWQKAYDQQYAGVAGTVADREIAARVVTADLREVLDVARAALSYAKATLRQLESNQSSLQTQFRAVSITYAEAGRS